jgi:hypothetical protein
VVAAAMEPFTWQEQRSIRYKVSVSPLTRLKIM